MFEMQHHTGLYMKARCMLLSTDLLRPPTQHTQPQPNIRKQRLVVGLLYVH
jgi:hypothetical protein